ncbi:ABC transporter A family protein [Heterostelium album PN500]|uniref:ABC transporter A family protein n=1 Tax=Heterostelium pallidum (strain ATCC 26659 / Pp 5 / PN500) TaxID=670386 RepID=D3BE52_HETP5|nr:ABC transporter A family protein [Heterostelium album PN500]EFA80183.1 ABC transporter A family protein [Heterostelium album PN500]|eukprot:XP_020432303.1 ABC transporter A family protein [Heterostelium album PN500]
MTLSETIKRNLLQTKLLLKKNVVVAIRSWISTVIELLSPVFFILILLIIAHSPSPMNSLLQRPVTKYGDSLPLCKPYTEDRCFTLMFAPITPLTTELMTILGQINDPPLSITTNLSVSYGIVAMDSADAILSFVQEHPNVTMGGIQFNSMPFNFSTRFPDDPIVKIFSPLIDFNILWNSSCPNFIDPTACTDWAVPINLAMHRAINTMLSQERNITTQPTTTVTTSTYPLYDPSANSVATYGCLFFYCGAMISFIFLMYKISYEKEKKLKQGMIMMGLSGTVYWVSWFITCLILNVLLTLITIAMGAAVQFQFFLSTNFFVNFLTFFLFAITMNQVAFFILTFIQTTKAAIGIGMTIFIIGSILQLIFSSMGVLIFQILYQTNSTYALVARIFLYVLPMSHFSKAITDINTITMLSKYTGAKFTWSDLYLNLNSPDSKNVNIPETYESLVNLVILAIAYTVLAWYFEHVVPGNDGNSYPPWFFLLPSYWGITQKKAKHIPTPHFEDADVVEAIEKAHSTSNRAPVTIQGLSKTYNNIFNKSRSVKAVKYLSHNGAGKTTTIGILTGLISPSSGDAMIFGKSIVREMDEVRKMTSVCPQHDILWNELTALEHLQLFSELKGIPVHERQTAIDEALESVKLRKVANNQINTYSGGMKRRLSVAIATIGDPKIIFLDEPTTGMDPQSRRHIWNLFKEIKKDKVIILTTHLMEEADILADRIVIMSHGQMACNGNSLQLKHRFGEGYSINVIAKTPEQAPEIKAIVQRLLPQSKLLNEAADFMNFGFSLDTDPNIVINFFKQLETISKNSETSPIRDWGVSHTTLDDVFIRVTKLKQN